MTKKEIIEALECWSRGKDCTGCPFLEKPGCFGCEQEHIDFRGNVLNLIESQQTEITRLNSELNRRFENALASINNLTCDGCGFKACKGTMIVEKCMQGAEKWLHQEVDNDK